MPDTPMSNRTLRLHPDDNLIVALAEIKPGEAVPQEDCIALDPVPTGYKIATRAIAKGEPIRKYNVTIGFASEDVAPGKLLHSHNIEFRDFERQHAPASEYRPVEPIPETQRATFEGIVRADGRVATRNYIGICSSVNCSATVVRRIADWFTEERLAEYPNVDGVVAFSHGLGCGMEMSGEPMDLLRRTIMGHATHANLAAALVIGLGCERNQIKEMMQATGIEPGPQLHTLTMQGTGGTRRAIEAGIEAVQALLPEANRVTRQTVPISHLKVGLQCGGSDAFSGITANPALGAAVDLLARHGGTGILSETPEIFGVEHTLTRRACSVEVGQKLINTVNWWKNVYSVGRDVQINGKVSPGNHTGGLANIFEKSLGSAMKGGSGPLMEVYRYAEQVTASGFVFMDSPGYDPVSITGQIAGGANLVAFTTGRGSMFGSKPAPCLKLASNSAMFNKLEEDMDIDCGVLLSGSVDMPEMAQRILDVFIATASGQKSKSELLGLGDNEFVPWSIGIMS